MTDAPVDGKWDRLAHSSGAIARHAGRSIDMNPFFRLSHQWASWRAGWQDEKEWERKHKPKGPKQGGLFE